MFYLSFEIEGVSPSFAMLIETKFDEEGIIMGFIHGINAFLSHHLFISINHLCEGKLGELLRALL